MAIMGDYQKLVNNFLKNEIHIKRENLKKMEISGLSKEFEEEVNHSNLLRVLGGLLNTNGLILAYDVDEENKTFKYWDKNGKVIGLTIRPNNENGEIGISEDGIEKRWKCINHNDGSVDLEPTILGVIETPISTSRKFKNNKASISFYNKKYSLSIKVERDNNEEIYLLPHEDELINHLMSLLESEGFNRIAYPKINLAEIYQVLGDITGIDQSKVKVMIETSRIGHSKDEKISSLIISNDKDPSFTEYFISPDEEIVSYTVTDTGNGHFTLIKNCKNANTTDNDSVPKNFEGNISILELYNIMENIIKNARNGRIKKRRD